MEFSGSKELLADAMGSLLRPFVYRNAKMTEA